MSRHKQQLKEIWEQLQEFVHENQTEVADLEQRLKRAKQKRETLLVRLKAAKANYEAATSAVSANYVAVTPPTPVSASFNEKHVVDLLDEEDDIEFDQKPQARSAGTGSEKRTTEMLSPRRASSIARRRRRAASSEEDRILKTPPLGHRKVLDLFDCCSSDEDDEKGVVHRKNGPTDSLSSVNDKKRHRSPREDWARNGNYSGDKRPRSLSATKPPTEARGSATGLEQNQHRAYSTSNTGCNGSQNEFPLPLQHTPTNSTGTFGAARAPFRRENATSDETSQTQYENRALSKRTTSKRTVKKRKSTGPARICYRTRPEDVPRELWLEPSIGRTRNELNKIDDMVQYVPCKFGQRAVCSKDGTVYAIVLNDEWNDLARRNDELQNWFVGLGPQRKQLARLVGACTKPIPIFHAPKKEHKTQKIYYVGHYRVLNIQELNPTVVVKGTERDIKLTFAFDGFDSNLNSVIQRGPPRSVPSNRAEEEEWV